MSLFDPISLKTEKRKTQLYQCDALDNVGFTTLEPRQSYHFFSDGQISLHQVIAKCLGIIGASNMHLLTWSLSSPAMKALINLKQEGLILNAKAVLDKRAPNDHADAYSMALNFFSGITIASNHSKVVVLQNKNLSVAITGSANLTNNPKQEYFMVSTNPALISYFLKTITKMAIDGAKIV